MNIADLVEYYRDLLIIQYNNQPKAKATIELFSRALLANGIFLDIEQAYDIDTAVGVQLDVIGKYVGVDRYWQKVDLVNYFSLETYAEASPSSPPRWGFCTYDTFEDFAYNGTLVYGDIVASSNALSDDDFRVLIKLKIIQNNSNYSRGSIDEEMWNFFGATVRPESNGRMAMAYFITALQTPLIQAILFKELLPRPMGVQLAAVNNITGLMFAFIDYNGYESPFAYGFSTYSDFDSLPGQVLSYDQITEV
jgi:hypothetical protein